MPSLQFAPVEFLLPCFSRYCWQVLCYFFYVLQVQKNKTTINITSILFIESISTQISTKMIKSKIIEKSVIFIGLRNQTFSALGSELGAKLKFKKWCQWPFLILQLSRNDLFSLQIKIALIKSPNLTLGCNFCHKLHLYSVLSKRVIKG